VVRRLFTAVFVVLAIFVAANTCAAELTIAWDGFESNDGAGGGGWSGNWAFSGTVDVIGGTTGPHTGSYHLRLRSSDGIATRAVNMAGVTAAHLKFWWKAYSFEAGETAVVEVYDGAWHTVLTVVDGNDDNTYHSANVNLSGYNMVSNFQVRAASHMGGPGDYFYIDDVNITGTIQRTLTTSATSGGTVTQPGIGDFNYPDGNVVNLVATADLHYQFVNWTGSAVTAGRVAAPNSAATTVTMDANYTVTANFASDMVISGTITCASRAVNDVNVAGLGVVTDVNGFYTAIVSYGWSGTVTPAKYGYAFDPNSRSYTNVTSDQTNQDYDALPADDFNDNRRGSMWRYGH